MVTRAAFDLHRLLGLVAFSSPCFAIDELQFSGGGPVCPLPPTLPLWRAAAREAERSAPKAQLSPCHAGSHLLLTLSDGHTSKVTSASHAGLTQKGVRTP